VFTGKDEKYLSIFDEQLGLTWRNRRKTKNIKVQGVLADFLQSSGITVNHELLKFKSGSDGVQDTAKNSNTWHSAFAKSVAKANTPLTMWFISETDITESVVPKVETDARRRLTALSDRFRRLREFQARTSM